METAVPTGVIPTSMVMGSRTATTRMSMGMGFRTARTPTWMATAVRTLSTMTSTETVSRTTWMMTWTGTGSPTRSIRTQRLLAAERSDVESGLDAMRKEWTRRLRFVVAWLGVLVLLGASSVQAKPPVELGGYLGGALPRSEERRVGKE